MRMTGGNSRQIHAIWVGGAGSRSRFQRFRELSASSHKRAGSRSPSCAQAMILRAMISVTGSLRSRKPSRRRTYSNAAVMAAIA